jgi:hypothetical protein
MGPLCEKKTYKGQISWGMPVIPTLGRLRQENHKFEASLLYIVSSRLAWAAK